MSENFTFHSYGNDSKQIGHVAGDVNIGASHGAQPSLADGVTALRRALDAAREQDEVDAATYADARQALDEAAQFAEPDDEEQRNALVRALRKVRGLVENVSGLAGAVAGLIAVVTGQR
ncbi:hypothetical protein [Streptomyces sp. NPDC048643]|uniref:hypothetical protein n=1 Tax=Streptomyces sp. NPDC048643 TaxID=3155637 RepID=UPI003430DAB6